MPQCKQLRTVKAGKKPQALKIDLIIKKSTYDIMRKSIHPTVLTAYGGGGRHEAALPQALKIFC